MLPIQLPIGTMLNRRARYTPDLEALVGPRRRLTYGEFDAWTSRIARWLNARGIRKGDRVVLFTETNILFPLLYLGAAKAGAVTVPLNWRWTPELIRWAIRHVEPSVLFYDESFRDLILSLSLPDDLPAILVSRQYDIHPDFEAELYTYPDQMPEIDISGDDRACITFTSGTTGKPKGVVATHNNIYAAGICNGFMTPVREEGYRFLYSTPLFHISATSVLGYQALGGFTAIFLPKLEPQLLLETIERERVHSTFIVPALLNLMLPIIYQSGLTLSSLKEISTGGSPVPFQLVKDYERLGFRIIQGYGLTENTGTVTFWHPGMGWDSYGSVGKPFMNEIRILDRQTREELPVGHIGELAVRGPMMFKEYWRDPEATKAAFHDGWLLTGDAARIDERGFVYLVDRYKDVIYFSGVDAIYPSEVENVVRELEGVADVAVIGVKHERWGEIPCAFIVRKPGAELTRADVLRHTHSRLDKHKLLDAVFVDELPRNMTGKVEKPKLQALYAEAGPNL